MLKTQVSLLHLMSMQTVVCAGNNYKSPAFQSLVTFCLQFNNTFYVLLILLILLLYTFIKYIYINCFFRCCRSHHPGTCPNIDIVKQYKKKTLNYKLPDIPMPDKYIEEVLKNELVILDIDKKLKTRKEPKLEDYENQDRGKAKSVEKKRAKIRKELEEDGDFSDGDMETSSDKKMETSNQTQGDWDRDVTDGETETLVERQRKYTKQKEVDEDCGISDAEKKTSVQGTRKSKKKSREQEDGDIVDGDKVLPRRGQSAKKSETKKETDYDTMGDTSRCKSSTSSVEILSMTTRKMKQAKGFEVKLWLQERDVLVLPSHVKADIMQNLSIARHDYKIWKQIEKDISLCRSNYVRVTNVCREHKGKLAKTSLVISSLFNKRLDFDNQDTLAHSLILRDGNIDRSDI